MIELLIYLNNSKISSIEYKNNFYMFVIYLNLRINRYLIEDVYNKINPIIHRKIEYI